jgi:hypothetical protein
LKNLTKISVNYKIYYINIIFSPPKRSFVDANQACKDLSPLGALATNLISLWDEYEMYFGRTFLRDELLQNRDPDDLEDGFWLGLSYSGLAV